MASFREGGTDVIEPKTDFVAASGPMVAVMGNLRKVAPLDTTVLLQGESGTGKEVAARFVHDTHPRRRRGPLVAVNCGAIPATLLESELFGHVRGAFTGADRDRVGRFEQADGGTLFLDEISTMTPDAQVRLLRVLQERSVTRLGATDARPVDVRVVVATNQDLEAAVQNGGFRLDLYYRVSAYPITLPPLRERPGDLLPLVEFLARRVARRMGLERARELSSEALGQLAAYAWPGNVRELENVVEYATIQAEGPTIERRHLPAHLARIDASSTTGLAGIVVTEDGLSFRTAVTNLERELILQSLRLAEGNKARAAELLELKRTTFLEKLRRLEVEGLLSVP